jgi:hypothetical protein
MELWRRGAVYSGAMAADSPRTLLEKQMAKSHPSIVRTGAMIISMCALAACGALGSEANEVDPAYVQFEGQTSTITVNDTVTHGQVFAISINTFGGGCTDATAGEDVTITGNTVEIHPMNRTTAATTCGTQVISLNHIVTATVPDVGTATIKVVGLTDQASAESTDNLLTLTKTIVVR